ncbi:MAG: HAD-IA family hydrolase [Roseobacter sp.]|jgi:phosphoglycolate phosphatase|nr:HAD-IA family hydrolase [Roseobacter sp.]
MDWPLRLIVFDVDGTLVDSQADILAAMAMAFGAEGLPVPDRSNVLSIVGLSLPVAIARLAPLANGPQQDRLVEGYKAAYVEMRAQTGAAQSSPLYPGALETLEHLYAQPDVVMGVATGKSRRGLDKLVEAHDLERFFVTRQVADFHPSKPHPSMLLQAMSDAGVAPEATVMVGDTSFDMDMAAAAGARGIGVAWGYHPRHALTQASVVVESFATLPAALSSIWSETV